MKFFYSDLAEGRGGGKQEEVKLYLPSSFFLSLHDILLYTLHKIWALLGPGYAMPHAMIMSVSFSAVCNPTRRKKESSIMFYVKQLVYRTTSISPLPTFL